MKVPIILSYPAQIGEHTAEDSYQFHVSCLVLEETGSLPLFIKHIILKTMSLLTNTLDTWQLLFRFTQTLITVNNN